MPPNLFAEFTITPGRETAKVAYPRTQTGPNSARMPATCQKKVLGLS